MENDESEQNLANFDRDMMHRINKRAWELARIAYENFREGMQKDTSIRSKKIQPEDWNPS